MCRSMQVSCKDMVAAAQAGPDAVVAGLTAFLKGPLCKAEWLANTAPSALIHATTLEIFHSFKGEGGRELADVIKDLCGMLRLSKQCTTFAAAVRNCRPAAEKLRHTLSCL